MAGARPPNERVSRETRALTLFHLPSATAFTIRAWSRRTVRQTFLHSMECQSGVRLGAAPASISAADISACLPESVSQGSLVTEHPREVSPRSRPGDVVRGGLTLYPVDYRSAFASSLIPPPLPHQRPLQSAFPRGEATGLLRSPCRSLRGKVVLHRPVVRHPRQGNSEPLVPDHIPFWFK